MKIPVLPDSAPFTKQQRAWLSGYFAAILAARDERSANAHAHASSPSLAEQPALSSLPAEPPAETFPWHDSALPLVERLMLAKDEPLPLQLMSAMAQLNCGACGYLCQTYSAAIASGEETDVTKCSPGGNETAKALKRLLQEHRPSTATISQTQVTSMSRSSTTPYSRNNPFRARLLSSHRLTHPEAPKDVRHVVIDLTGSGLEYSPGDSLGVLPLNDPDLIAATLRQLGVEGDELVSLPAAEQKPIRELLATDVTLGRCRNELFELLLTHATNANDRNQLSALVAADENPWQGADLAEVLQEFPSARPPLEELVATLGKLQPRLYSIASSQRLHPSEVHLTVGVVRFETLGRWRQGVASHFLGVRSHPGDEVRVYVQPSPKFRLPENPQTPIIMIGPGTGIAPFRAFLEELRARGERRRTWLFFGNTHYHFDYLYRDDLTALKDDGTLERLDLAFSRDQAEKIYVQHRLLEKRSELWKWLEAGAHLFICGDAKRMAPDVQAALSQVIQTEGKRDSTAAKHYIDDLVREKRFHKDVY